MAASFEVMGDTLKIRVLFAISSKVSKIYHLKGFIIYNVLLAQMRTLLQNLAGSARQPLGRLSGQ
jgi:hypothetical protein